MFNTYFLDVIKSHYVDFAGRATRTQFWLFVLFQFIISLILGALAGMNNAVGQIFQVVYWIFWLALLLPSIAISARRLHDIGRSAWWLLIYFLPFIGWIVLLVFFLLPSKR